ncbi:MAG: hypothetical protein QM771_11215 [Nitrospira sp.]
MVQIGADGAGVHSAIEWAEEDSVATLTDILHDAVVDFCGPARR